MCVIIAKPKGKIVPENYIREAWKCNRDGGGFAFVNNGNIKIIKVLKSVDNFITSYRKHIENEEEKAILLHFRIKTHGEVSIKNTHPFYVHQNLAFAHNGIIGSHSHNREISDTLEFRDEVLKQLPKDFYKNNGMKKLIESYINYSKLAFLDSNEDLYIFNEEKGSWEDGIWYSNLSYRPYVTTVVQKPYNSYNSRERNNYWGNGYPDAWGDDGHDWPYKNNVIPLKTNKEICQSLNTISEERFKNKTITKQAISEKPIFCSQCGIRCYLSHEEVLGLCSLCAETIRWNR